MFTYYKMLTNSVAFFTTAILNTPKVKNSPKNGFFGEFRLFWWQNRPSRSKGDNEPYNSMPVSRSVGGSQAAT